VFAQLIVLMFFTMKWNCPTAFCLGQFENGTLLNIEMYECMGIFIQIISIIIDRLWIVEQQRNKDAKGSSF
jgi:hypothetical protein